MLNCFDILGISGLYFSIDISLRLSFSFLSNPGLWKESRAGSECWEDSIWDHCVTLLLTRRQWPRWPVSRCHVLPSHVSRSVTNLVSGSSEGSQQFCLVTPPPVGKWKMDSSLGFGRKRRGHNVTTSFQESSTQSRQDAGGSLSSSNGRQRISLDRSRLTFPSHAGLSLKSRWWWMRSSSCLN